MDDTIFVRLFSFYLIILCFADHDVDHELRDCEQADIDKCMGKHAKSPFHNLFLPVGYSSLNLTETCVEFRIMGNCFARLREQCKERFLLENRKMIYYNTSIVTDYVCDNKAKDDLKPVHLPVPNPCTDYHGEGAGCHKTYKREVDKIQSGRYGETETVRKLCRSLGIFLHCVNSLMLECGLRDLKESKVTYNNRLALFYTQNMNCKKDLSAPLASKKRRLTFGVPVLSMDIEIPSVGHKQHDRIAFICSAILMLLTIIIFH